MAFYLALGPVIGALSVIVGLGFTDPGLLRDGGVRLIVEVLVLSYPFGAPQAIAAGVAHVCVRQFITPRRPIIVLGSVVGGVSASIAFAALLGNVARILTSPESVAAMLLPPLVSASVIAWQLSGVPPAVQSAPHTK